MNVATPDAGRCTKNWDRTSLAGKYLTFKMADEQFGIQILKVREIIGLMNVTPVPGAPNYIRGVLNLRGKIIPVMELRKKFSIESSDDHERNCIIVVEVESDDHTVEMGILVDAVSEVLSIDPADIEPPPEFGVDVDTTFILGMAKSGPEVKILLHIDKIVLDGQRQLDVNQVMQAARDS